MAIYSLSDDAEADLIRIHQWGVRTHGVIQADEYYAAIFDCFDMLARQPLLYPIAEHVRNGYRKCVCGVDTIYYRIVGGNVKL